MELTASNIVCSYSRKTVLKGLSIGVSTGQIVSVIGANGVGKSSLLKVVAGVKAVDTGSIVIDGEDVTDTNAPERVRRGIVMCPEGRQLFPEMSVRENLLVGGIGARVSRQVRSEQWDRAVELFPTIGDRAGQLAGTLSGGEQQMVAIGRALMADPQVLVLDEPTLGLSPMLVDAVMDAIVDVAKRGIPVLLAEQNLYASLSISDYGYVVEGGVVVAEGKGTTLLNDEEIAETYLGVTSF